MISQGAMARPAVHPVSAGSLGQCQTCQEKRLIPPRITPASAVTPRLASIRRRVIRLRVRYAEPY